MDALPLTKQDNTAKALILILIMVTVGCWLTMIWSTYRTYQEAPPIPKVIQSVTGQVVMTSDDITQGKAGFQKAALMDYGSLYGMGSYFGEDYTAQYLVELAQTLMDTLAHKEHHKPLKILSESEKFSVQREMQRMLKEIQLNQDKVILPEVLSNAMLTFRAKIANDLLTDRFEKGWGRAESLNQSEAEKTADFLIYSVLTTVAHRPGKNFSWTNNWPPEPLVANAPTTETFTWTWASLTLLFFAIGVVVVIFRLYIDHPLSQLL